MAAELTSAERIALIHRGNALFHGGQVDLAERIFRTVRYQDGLRRVAERRFQQQRYLSALELYRLGKSLRGEVQCLEKLGLLEPGRFADVSAADRKAMDEAANQRIARVVSKMLSS